MTWPHLAKAKHQHYETGLDVETSGQAKEGGDRKTPGGMTLRQTSRKRGWAGNNWRGSPRTGDVGEMLCMAYAPGGAKGLSK